MQGRGSYEAKVPEGYAASAAASRTEVRSAGVHVQAQDLPLCALQSKKSRGDDIWSKADQGLYTSPTKGFVHEL